jgi:hypothetical protein
MIEAVKYRWQLRKLNKKYGELSKFHAEKEAEAKSSNDKEMLRAEAGSEIVPILEDIDSLQTKRFCQLANKLLVPIPVRSNKEMWCEKHYSYGRTLTDKGIWEIKKLIRQEKKERREGFIVWLAVLTGIIGAITGLAAVLTR